MFDSLKGYKELPIGGTVPRGGTAMMNKTGDWRTKRPVFHEENCIHCLFCYVYCPDMAIIVEDGKMAGSDYDYCKGCGICANECPGKKGNKALIMEDEDKFRKGGDK